MALPDDWQDWIEESQRLRGWLVNAFAQVEYLLGDLILRCATFEEYEEHTQSLPHGAKDRIARLRTILATSGPLHAYGVELLPLLDRLHNQQDTRNLLVHGFATVLHTPEGAMGIHFAKFHRVPGRKDARLVCMFTMQRLRDERAEWEGFATEALALFERIHVAMGWTGPLSFQFARDQAFIN